MNDWNALVRDFGVHVRSQRALPVVRKAFGARPLVGQVIAMDPIPDEPTEKPLLSGAKIARIERLVTQAAMAALKKIDSQRRKVTRRDAMEAFESAIQQQCSLVVDAASISPARLKAADDQRAKWEAERAAWPAERKAARKVLADELRATRRRWQDSKRKAAALERDATRIEAAICATAMGPHPQVPAPTLSPSRIGAGLPLAPGIYFLWKGGIVEYVGKSVRLCQRLTLGGHHVLDEDHRISYVEVDPRDLTWAECYYIGALRPYRNFGSQASHYRKDEA